MSRAPHRSPIPRAAFAFVTFSAFLPIACESSVTAISRQSDPPQSDAEGELRPEDADTIPCEPRAILETVCQKCHTRPPRNGAPFSLVTRSDIVRVGSEGEIRLLMIPQLDSKRMPLFPETLDDPRRAVLLDWLRAGAPPVSPRSCIDHGEAGPALTDAGDASTSDAADSSTLPDAGPADVCTLDSEADP